jgi:hypothetical protein
MAEIEARCRRNHRLWVRSIRNVGGFVAPIPSPEPLSFWKAWVHSGKEAAMRQTLVTIAGLFGTVLFVTWAFANPGMLPKHPGYPMGKAVDPVSGQSLANDPGQTNASGEKALSEAAMFDDAHVRQVLPMNANDQRLLEKPGAGQLPKVQGPQIIITPPVKEATKVQASP